VFERSNLNLIAELFGLVSPRDFDMGNVGYREGNIVIKLGALDE